MRRSPEGAKLMLLAGPNEILPSDSGDAPPDPKVLPALVAAYGKLGYNAGYITVAEGKALASAGAALPPGFLTAGDAPQKAVYTIGGNTIGVVFFPELGRAEGPSEAAIQAVAGAAASLRPDVKLVIGVSPWGSEAESRYLAHAKPAVDVLLGGGPGIGLTARPDATGKVLWMRSFGKGKTLDALDLLAWPGGADFTWKDKVNFTFQVISLGDDYAAKPEIDALFAAFAGDGKDVKTK
ncbi:MAG: hypothetical protein HQK81_12110 [Desulfovibrionaceae bacterium]|nr:hypothetical protein [Desulfovibrionaceae bacterium]MBF0514787.1 hypothetical protein [Desulfovibrionaceae bacterium]